MSYYYHHYHIYHHTPTNYSNTGNTEIERNDFVDKSEEFHVYDHCRPIPEEPKSPSRTPSVRNTNGKYWIAQVFWNDQPILEYNWDISELICQKCCISDNNNNLPSSVAKVKEVYHIYRSGSGASTPSRSHQHYGTASKPYDPYGRYQDHYGSNRSNGIRILKFGDTITEKSLENELGDDSNTASSHEHIEDIKGKEEQDNNNLHSGIIQC